MFTPTTVVDVLRGTTTNTYGDPIDANTVAISGLPMSIIEQRRTVFGPNQSQDRVVRTHKGRAAKGSGLLKGDRVRDRTTRQVYVIAEVYQQDNPFWPQPQSCDLIVTSTIQPATSAAHPGRPAAATVARAAEAR